VSYLLLRGRCRHCRAPISPLYFCVELATGLLALYLYSLFGLTAAFAKAATLGAGLLVLAVTDWQERLLPDRITFPGMAAGLVFSQIVPVNDGMGLFLTRLLGLDTVPRLDSLLDSLAGAAIGSGLVYFLGKAWLRLRHVEAMGFGDVKMMAMVGFFLGPQMALLTIFLGSMSGSILGPILIVVLISRPNYFKKVSRRLHQPGNLRFFLGLLRRKIKTFPIPFGSFLGVAAMVATIWGKGMLEWYLGYYR
jgi:leader peptidase (prepilin peptidase)/N-methyltransferase